MKKKAQVIMLPSKKQEYQVQKGQTFINDSRRDSWGALEALKCERVTNHGHAWSGSGIGTDINHLYIVTDDEIKEGDWYYNELDNAVRRNNTINHSYHKKIIATTDPKLFRDGDAGIIDHAFKEGMFNIPQSFIEEYCKAGGIDEVKVEYAALKRWSKDFDPCDKRMVKVNSHNEITIHLIKESWMREEIEMQLQHCVSLFASERGLTPTSVEMKEVNDWTSNWIKENL